MIGATRRWLRRNRTNFAIGVGVLGVGYVAGQYVINKISETRERMSGDRIARENLRRRFQQNQEDCTITVLALLPTATENILGALPVENITHELQQQKAERLGRSTGTSDLGPSNPSSGTPSVTDEDGRSLSSFQTESYIHTSQMGASGSGSRDDEPQRPKKSKAQLWSELKINSITRSLTLIYTLSLLTLLTRIQLNLLGRRNYLSSVVSLAAQPPNDPTISLENNDDDRAENSYGNDFETNRKFLTFSWWLLHRGWKGIMEQVSAAVKEVFGPLNPREDISLERLSALIVEVRKRVEGATSEDRKNHKWLLSLLPLQAEESLVLQESGMSAPPSESSSSTPPSPDLPLRRLLDETSDLIDSPPFTHILTLLLDTTFSHLTDEKLRTQAFKLTPFSLSPPTTNSSLPIDPTTPRITEITDPPFPSSQRSPPEAEHVDNGAETKTKLANILAVITRQAHAIGNGVPNEYVQAMEGVRELEAFAAVIYSSNFDLETQTQGSREAGKVERSLGAALGHDEVDEEVVEEGTTIAGHKKEGSGSGDVIADTPPTTTTQKGQGVFESVWGRVTGARR